MSELPDVRGTDERAVSTQLAARWVELFGPPGSAEDRAEVLDRFRSAYAYIDAVIHGIEPPEVP